MFAPATLPPPRRPDLLLHPIGDAGQHVVKDPNTGEYFNLAAQESFLLASLDGIQTVRAICAGFEARFGGPFTADELGDFLDLARHHNLVRATPDASAPAPAPS